MNRFLLSPEILIQQAWGDIREFFTKGPEEFSFRWLSRDPALQNIDLV